MCLGSKELEAERYRELSEESVDYAQQHGRAHLDSRACYHHLCQLYAGQDRPTRMIVDVQWLQHGLHIQAKDSKDGQKITGM